MGWLWRSSVAVGALVVGLSVVGRRWNATGDALFRDPIPTVDASFDGGGRRAVVTGGNQGIGLEMVRGLRKMNFDVVMACRRVEAGQRAAKQLEDEDPDAAAIEVRHLDLASFESVRSFAASFAGEKPISVLINNAGIWANQEPSVDGIPLTAQINHYSSFLLVNLLFPQLEQGGRVVLLSSIMANAGVDFSNDLHLRDPAKLASPRRQELYGSSKLMNVLHASAMAKRQSKVSVNSVHPGIIKTALHRAENDDPTTFVARFIAPLMYASIGLTLEEGARSSLYLATSPEVAGVTGQFFHGAKPRELRNPLARNVTLENLLWDESVRVTKSDLP